MNDLNEHLKPVELNYNPVTPKFIIIGYSDKNNESPYFEFKNISENGISSAKPLYKETLSNMLSLVKEEKQDTWKVNGILPKNILSLNPEQKQMVWVVKTPVQYLHFDKDRVKSGVYHLPTLAFKLDNLRLSVFALKSTHIKAKLYHAPFYNVYHDGSVCMGNAKIKPKHFDLQTIISTAEKSFFGSLFTHSNNGSIIKNMNYRSFMNSIVDRAMRFDNNVLIKTKKSLIEIL